jgi:hypothetical protein
MIWFNLVHYDAPLLDSGVDCDIGLLQFTCCFFDVFSYCLYSSVVSKGLLSGAYHMCITGTGSVLTRCLVGLPLLCLWALNIFFLVLFWIACLKCRTLIFDNIALVAACVTLSSFLHARPCQSLALYQGISLRIIYVSLACFFMTSVSLCTCSIVECFSLNPNWCVGTMSFFFQLLFLAFSIIIFQVVLVPQATVITVCARWLCLEVFSVVCVVWRHRGHKESTAAILLAASVLWELPSNGFTCQNIIYT